MKSWILVGCSVLLGVLGQLFMKKGMMEIGATLAPNINTIFSIIFQIWVILGLLCYASAMLIWLAVLAELDLSYAYPLLSSGYILVALGSWLMFKESISLIRWIGIIVIFGGVVITARK